MLFRKDMLIKDIKQQFSRYDTEVRDENDVTEIRFGGGSDTILTLYIVDEFTLSFDNWNGKYTFTDDEYERLLWDIGDILANRAFSLSVYVGEHLYINYLGRQELANADDFVEEDPRERYGLYKTGAQIKCVYFDPGRNRNYTIEKRM
ncbi:MAG: hypothetical protein IK990_15745 [Ruminiclostridium sp.]|nr:hypothetical protein [Ruminiclostridium sp.]